MIERVAAASELSVAVFGEVAQRKSSFMPGHEKGRWFNSFSPHQVCFRRLILGRLPSSTGNVGSSPAGNAKFWVEALLDDALQERGSYSEMLAGEV